MQESQIESKTVMSWSSRKKKRAIFVPLILTTGIILTFVFYFNVYCIETL